MRKLQFAIFRCECHSREEGEYANSVNGNAKSNELQQKKKKNTLPQEQMNYVCGTADGAVVVVIVAVFSLMMHFHVGRYLYTSQSCLAMAL